MAPKVKYSREEILEAAVSVIVEKGMNGLTARGLAGTLGISVKPIFTAFENMDELKNAAIEMAYEKYHHVYDAEKEQDPFKRVGKTYISFSQQFPKLFQLLFMCSQEKSVSFTKLMKKLDDHYEDTLRMIEDEYKVDHGAAEKLFMNMWIYCHGIATLCATNQSKFSKKEIDQLTADAFFAFEAFFRGVSER